MKKLTFTLLLSAFLLIFIELSSWAAVAILAEWKGIYATGSLPIEPDKKLKEVLLEHVSPSDEEYKKRYSAFDYDCGWTLNPNADVGKVEGISIGTTNSLATRNTKEYHPTDSKGKLRIAAFGDSFTHCANVPNHFTWAEMLEARNQHVEVLNFGVSGYGVDQAYWRYLKEGVKTKPDIVFIGYMTENLARHINIYRGFYERGGPTALIKPRFKLTAGGGLEKIPNPLESRHDYLKLMDEDFLRSFAGKDFWSEQHLNNNKWLKLNTVKILTILIRQLSGHLNRQPMKTDLLMEEFLKPTEHHYIYRTESEAYKLTVKILEKFYREVERNGSKPVILLFPDRYDLEMNLRYNEEVRYKPLANELKNMGLDYLDIKEVLLPMAKEMGLRQITQSHYTPDGNGAVALYLDYYLRRAGLTPQD